MRRQALRILVVDDHPLVRAGLQAGILARFPDAVISEAGSADEAVSLMAESVPDMALLDVNLPGLNGIDLARRILSRHGRVKILVVAGESDPWTVSEAINAGVSGFVTKTCSAEFLCDAVRSVMEGRMVLGPDAQAALEKAENRLEFNAEAPPPAVLSAREKEILRHLAQGENTKAIAAHLGISPKTVETHRQHIMGKLRIQSVALLTRYAIRHGLAPA